MCHYSLFQKHARAGNSAIGYFVDSEVLLDSALQRGVRIGPGKQFHAELPEWSKLFSARAVKVPTYSSNGSNVQSRYLGLNR
jgi:hypothetical protein